VIGADRITGKPIGGDAHLEQSLGDLLSTPIGSRVMRRDYGVDLGSIIDAPLSPRTVVDFFMAAAEAIGKWEPRYTLRRVQVADATREGAVQVTLSGVSDGRQTDTGVLIQVTR